MEAEGAGGADAADLHVRRIVGRRRTLGIRAERGGPEGTGRAIADALVRAFMVVALAEGIESTLLRAESAGRRTRRLSLQLAMHPLMGAVLLWTRGRDALVNDAELHPPDVQCREAVDAGRGEGRAVVGADGIGQAHLAEERAEDGLRLAGLHRGQAVAGQHAAAEMIGHRQRVAVLAVARMNWPLKSAGQT